MTMAAPDIDAQVMEIGSVVGRRLDEMAEQVASSVRANVEFYKDTSVVSADELLSSSTENIRFLFNGLRDGAAFDTSPAVATGTNRAAAGVPLPVVMDAFRVALHHLWDAMIEVAGGTGKHRPRRAVAGDRPALAGTGRLHRRDDGSVPPPGNASGAGG